MVRGYDQSLERENEADYAHLMIPMYFDPMRETLRTARPALPEALNDRAQDNWEPLLGIADLAGGDWPKAARDAALELSVDAETEASSLSTQRRVPVLRIVALPPHPAAFPAAAA